MPDVRVVPEGKKFKILVNYIQRGIEYTSQEMANHDADPGTTPSGRTPKYACTRWLAGGWGRSHRIGGHEWEHALCLTKDSCVARHRL